MTTMKKTATLTAILLPACLLLGSPAMAQDFAGNALSIDNLVGRVTVTTADVDKVSVDIDNGQDVMDAPKAWTEGGVVHVGYDHKQVIKGCTSTGHLGGKNVKLRLKNGSAHELAAYPSIRVTVPRNADLSMKGGAIFGSAGDMGQADISISSCGDFAMGNVNGDMRAQINGSGDLKFGDVSGSLKAGINGSGDVRTGAVSGETRLAINGSGDMSTGAVQGLVANINGSGDVRVASVAGSVAVTINGSGDVGIKGGEAAPLSVTIRGSGDVDFDGHARDVEVTLAGSGDIDVRSFEGSLKKVGSRADVRIKDGHLHVGN